MSAIIPDTPVLGGWGQREDTRLKQMADMNFMRNQVNSTGSQIFFMNQQEGAQLQQQFQQQNMNGGNAGQI